MRKEQAESEMKKHIGLVDLELQHSVYNKKMKLVQLEIRETHPGSGNYFVSCELSGHLGHFRETLDYVMKNYVSTQTG